MRMQKPQNKPEQIVSAAQSDQKWFRDKQVFDLKKRKINNK